MLAGTPLKADQRSLAGIRALQNLKNQRVLAGPRRRSVATYCGTRLRQRGGQILCLPLYQRLLSSSIPRHNWRMLMIGFNPDACDYLSQWNPEKSRRAVVAKNNI